MFLELIRYSCGQEKHNFKMVRYSFVATGQHLQRCGINECLLSGHDTTTEGKYK